MLLIVFGLLLGTLFVLARRARLRGGPPVFFKAPEQEARTTLANRLAQGDISTEEFLERAAVLNWTPGIHDGPPASAKTMR